MEKDLQSMDLNMKDLISVMQMMLSPDNEKLDKASVYLKKYIKTPQSIKTLLEVLSEQVEGQYQQMAVILLKKAIVKHFEGLSEADTRILGNTILQIYFKSTLRPVKSVLANLIAQIANFYFSQEKLWPEVLQEISNRAEGNSTPEELRDALVLLRNLLDGNEDELQSSFPAIIAFLEKVMASNNNEIVIESLKCLSFIVGSLKEDFSLKNYGHLLQSILTTFDVLNKAGVEEDLYFIIIDLIVHLAQVNSKILDANKSRQLLEYFLGEKGLKSTHLPKNIKDGILSMMNVLSDYKRTFFTKNKDLVENLLIQMVQFMLAAQKLGNFDDNETCLGFSSIKVLESFATNLPKKVIRPPLTKILNDLYKSKENKKLLCMYIIYSAVAQGLQDILKPELPRLMKDEISFGLSHEDTHVRNAAIKAVSYFSEFLLPNILEYTNIVIPSLVNSLESSDMELVEHSIFVIDVFCEYLEEDQIKDYLPTLVPKIITMISHPKATYRIRKFSIDALCSLMNAGKDYFTPYLESSYNILKEIVSSNLEEISLVHGAALSCAGKLIQSVCEKDKSLFTSKFLDFHNLAVNYVQTQPNNYDLMEGCYQFFYLAVEALGEEYGREVISKVFNHAKEMIGKENRIRKTSGDDMGLDDDDDEEGGDYVFVNLDEAKSAALHLFYELGQHSPFAFKEIEEAVCTIIEGHLDYDENESPQLRQQTLAAIRGVLISKLKRHHNGNLPVFKRGWDTPSFPADVESYFKEQFYMKTEFYIENEPSKEDVCLAIESIKDTLHMIGPAGLKGEAEHFVKLIQNITSFDLVCFEKGDEDDEDQESDGKIFMATVDLLVEIAEILHNDAFGILSEVLQGIFDLVEKGNVFELDEFLGGYCDIVEKCPKIISKQTDNVTDMIYESPSLNDPLPVRNGCFLLGVMHKSNPEVMNSYIAKSLEFYMKVHSSFKEPEIKDNVVAGIIRIYSVDKMNVVPQEKLIETLIASYPFVGDTSENPSIIMFEEALLAKDPSAFAKNMDAMVKMLLDNAINVEKYKTSDEDKAALKQLINKLSTDPASKAALEKHSAGLDQQALAKFTS